MYVVRSIPLVWDRFSQLAHFLQKTRIAENRVKINGMECTTYNVRGPPSAAVAVVVAENSGRVFCFFLATRLATFLFT